MELNRSSFHAQSESVFLPLVDKFLFILLQCFLGVFESFCFPFPPRAIIRSSQFIQRSSEAWIKKIFRLRSSFDSRRRRRRIERVHLSRSSEKHFRNLQKNGKGGVSAICGLRYYPASIEASSGQDILSARRIPPLFLPRKQRAAAREACSGLVVCLPLTSTLLDKDNAPSLIRFGDNSFRPSPLRAGEKSRGRSRFPGTSNRFFSLSLSLSPLSQRVIRKEVEQHFLCKLCDEFLFVRVPTRRGNTERWRRGKYGQRGKRARGGGGRERE